MILVMDNSGQISGDVRPLVRMNVQVIVEHDGKREQGSAGGGARQGLDFFISEERALGYAEAAGGPLLIAGSLYLVGDLRARLVPGTISDTDA